MAKRRSYELIYENDNYIIVNKAPGVLVIQDRYNDNLINIRSMLESRFGDIYVVHRIDKGTSGILCFARNEKAHKHLNEQFQAREVQKEYLAICNGEAFKESGTIENLIAKDDHKKGKMRIVRTKGLHAITHYQVAERFRNYTCFKVQIETGRTHQIRVHLSSIGHPLVGDPMYGGQETLGIRDLKRYVSGNNTSTLISRPALHAQKIGFTDISNNAFIEFECDLPKDMRALTKQLQKWKAV